MEWHLYAKRTCLGICQPSPLWFESRMPSSLQQLGIKPVRPPCYHFLQAGTHTFSSQLLLNFGVDRETYYSYISSFNMVQFKLSQIVAFIIVTATIAPIVALPTGPPRSISAPKSVFISILCSMIIFDLSAPQDSCPLALHTVTLRVMVVPSPRA